MIVITDRMFPFPQEKPSSRWQPNGCKIHHQTKEFVNKAIANVLVKHYEITSCAVAIISELADSKLPPITNKELVDALLTLRWLNKAIEVANVTGMEAAAKGVTEPQDAIASYPGVRGEG